MMTANQEKAVISLVQKIKSNLVCNNCYTALENCNNALKILNHAKAETNSAKQEDVHEINIY